MNMNMNLEFDLLYIWKTVCSLICSADPHAKTLDCKACSNCMLFLQTCACDEKHEVRMKAVVFLVKFVMVILEQKKKQATLW